MKTLFGAFLITLISGSAWANSIPSQPTGYISDQADVLTSEIEQELETQLKQLEKETTAEVALLTIPSTNETPIFNYALEVAETWKIGKAANDNGLLILIASQDRAYQMLTGYGLEGALPDARLNQIARKHFIPHFREGDYTTGISNALQDITAFIKEDPSVIAQYEKENSFDDKLGIIQVLGLVLIVILNLWGSFEPKQQIKRTGIAGTIFGIFAGWFLPSILIGIIAAVIIFLFANSHDTTKGSPTWGRYGSRGGGGFGGFGGGSFGGGGSGGRW